MSATRQYPVIAYRQSKHSQAPTLLSLVVPAEELLCWAGIPRRAEQHLVGFQRPDDKDRVLAAQMFFNLSCNQSPTALIVGIHKGTPTAKLELQGDPSKSPVPGVLVIEDDLDSIPLEEVVERVRMQLTGRLQTSSDQNIVGTNAEDDLEPDDDLGAEGDVEDGSGDEVELGKSIIDALLQKLDDANWVSNNEEHLRAMARPATVIDGQHRLMGAAKCERRIPFQVCAIYDCPWEEQVFQFTIVNYKQKGIPDQFITANAALSLTSGELEQLQERLVQANVKVVEYELMKTVQFDPESPFHEKVNLTEKSTSHLIGYKTMVRIANAWYQARATGTTSFFQFLLDSLYPEMPGKANRKKRQDRWKEGDWSRFFLDYWNSVRQWYGHLPSHNFGKTLWDVGNSQLTIAIVLLEFQNIFFESLSDQDDDFFKVESGPPIEFLRNKLKKRAQKVFETFPAEFFQAEWKEKSLNTGAGRSVLQVVFRQMKTSKGAFNWKNSALVKGAGASSKSGG